MLGRRTAAAVMGTKKCQATPSLVQIKLQVPKNLLFWNSMPPAKCLRPRTTLLARILAVPRSSGSGSGSDGDKPGTFPWDVRLDKHKTAGITKR